MRTYFQKREQGTLYVICIFASAVRQAAPPEYDTFAFCILLFILIALLIYNVYASFTTYPERHIQDVYRTIEIPQCARILRLIAV